MKLIVLCLALLGPPEVSPNPTTEASSSQQKRSKDSQSQADSGHENETQGPESKEPRQPGANPIRTPHDQERQNVENEPDGIDIPWGYVLSGAQFLAALALVYFTAVLGKAAKAQTGILADQNALLADQNALTEKKYQLDRLAFRSKYPAQLEVKAVFAPKSWLANFRPRLTSIGELEQAANRRPQISVVVVNTGRGEAILSYRRGTLNFLGSFDPVNNLANIFRFRTEIPGEVKIEGGKSTVVQFVGKRNWKPEHPHKMETRLKAVLFIFEFRYTDEDGIFTAKTPAFAYNFTNHRFERATYEEEG